jgi:hypothetical protein
MLEVFLSAKHPPVSIDLAIELWNYHLRWICRRELIHESTNVMVGKIDLLYFKSREAS